MTWRIGRVILQPLIIVLSASYQIFFIMFLASLHHLCINQEHPCPPRLQEETWSIGGFLMRFLLFDLDKTFSKAS